MGKELQGNQTHLRAIRRAEETQGIGVSIDTSGSNGWEQTNTNFQSTLNSLKENHDIPEDSSSSKSKKRIEGRKERINLC